jgi:hypothetical protein
MRSPKLALFASGAVTVLLVPAISLGLPASPASAQISNACSFGQFPNAPGGDSGLSVSCTFASSPGSAETIEDFPQAQWHDGASWAVTGAVTTSGSATVTASTGHFNASTDINDTISGTGIPADSFIVAVASPTSITLNNKATLSESADKLTINNSDTRQVANGVTTKSSKTITSATANFTAADVGGIVTSTNLPGYDAIASVTNATTAVLTTAATAAGTLQTFTIDANQQSSTAREIGDAQITAGSTTLSSASASFEATDAQLPVTGCGIPAGTYIASITDPGDVVLSQAATVTRPFAVSDGSTTSGSTTVTSASAGFSTACDADKAISGAGIPAGAYIKTVTNASTVVISAAATATATGVSLTESPGATEVIGLPSATAPANDDAVSELGSELTLNPTLVKGSSPCASADPTGTTIEGGWYNPGSYLANTLAPQTTPVDSIGEILYPTSVVSFAGYVVNEAANTPGEQDTAAHTDIVLPFVPTALALCPSPNNAIGSVFRFNGTTITQQKVLTGVGTPGTGAVRGIQNLGSGVSTTTGTAYLTNGTTGSPYSGACTTTFPAVIGYSCGEG